MRNTPGNPNAFVGAALVFVSILIILLLAAYAAEAIVGRPIF